MKMGDVESALKDFDNEIKVYSTLADPYYWKGMIYLELGMNAEAKGQLATALELINGKGIKHKDPYAEVQNEIYVSDVEEAISKLK